MGKKEKPILLFNYSLKEMEDITDFTTVHAGLSLVSDTLESMTEIL